MADELIRYPRIRSFILKPKAFLSLNPINYELNNTEIILLEQLLLEKYFQDIVLRQENKYIKTKRFYEIINPDKSEKYTDNFSLKKIQKEHETKELMDYSISDCIITNHRESAFEGKQGSFSGAGKFWRDLGLDSRFSIKEFKLTPECSWDVIKLIYNNYYGKSITIDELKKTLIDTYTKLFQIDDNLIKKILQSITWKNRFFHSNKEQKNLNEVFDDDYYLSFLDLLILINNYKLPVAIISRLTLPSFNRLKTGPGYSRKSILLNPENKKSIYIIFGSRWKQTPLLPVYSMISTNNIFKIDIELFPQLNKVIQTNKITFDEYLNEQKWHLIKKRKKKKIIKIRR